MARQKTLDRSIRWETEDSPERPAVIGLLADPGLPAEIAEQLAEELPEMLATSPEPGSATRSRWSPKRCGAAGTPAASG